MAERITEKKDIKGMHSREEIRAYAEALTQDYNAFVQEGEFSEASPIAEEIDQCVAKYTEISRLACFNALKAEENPMIEAVKQLTFPTIRAKDSRSGDEKIPVRSIEDSERYIDLLALHKHVGGDGIGADRMWAYKAEKMNMLMTVFKAKELGIPDDKIKEINDSYAMAEISKSIDLGKNPISNSNLLRTLTTIVQAMIGEEYKPTSHDVAYLKSVYSNGSRKPRTVKVSNHKYMRQHLANICNHIVTKLPYEVDYRKAKN